MIRGVIKYFLSVCLFGLGFGQVDYSEIQTIFDARCISCHGNSAGLNLYSYSNLMNGSDNGDVITPYDHSTSELWKRINSGQMPPGNSDCTNAEVDLIAQWIDEGALATPGSSSGCIDPEAYNCADDFWNDGEDYPNYTIEVGSIIYVNGCNYDTDDFLNIIYVGGCDDGPCVGYYNPGASEDDSSCDYYQAPHGDDVKFTVTPENISLDWTDWAINDAPTNADINGYHVSRCIEDGCVFITDSPFPWGSNNGLDTTSIIDDYVWIPNVEIKYAINVKYSNAEGYGMAIGVSYITPESCPDMGDLNDDGGWNVLDIVQLANCVLAVSCADLETGCAGDMNGDGGWNVLDIVMLANCVLSVDCGR